MADAPLMPKATAVWLLDNTTLTFDQIAEFCRLHPLEVKAIADGESAQGIKGMDPIVSGQLTREELDQAIAEPAHRLRLVDTRFRAQVGKAARTALYAGIEAPGPAERDPLADPQPS